MNYFFKNLPDDNKLDTIKFENGFYDVRINSILLNSDIEIDFPIEKIIIYDNNHSEIQSTLTFRQECNYISLLHRVGSIKIVSSGIINNLLLKNTHLKTIDNLYCIKVNIITLRNYIIDDDFIIVSNNFNLILENSYCIMKRMNKEFIANIQNCTSIELRLVDIENFHKNMAFTNESDLMIDNTSLEPNLVYSKEPFFTLCINNLIF